MGAPVVHFEIMGGAQTVRSFRTEASIRAYPAALYLFLCSPSSRDQNPGLNLFAGMCKNPYYENAISAFTTSLTHERLSERAPYLSPTLRRTEHCNGKHAMPPRPVP